MYKYNATKEMQRVIKACSTSTLQGIVPVFTLLESHFTTFESLGTKNSPFIDQISPNHFLSLDLKLGCRQKMERYPQDKSLELKLAPPGENKPLISLHYISPKSYSNVKNNNLPASGTKREFLDTIIEEKGQDRNWLSGVEKKAYVSSPGLNTGLPNSSKRIDVRPIVGWPPVRSSRRNLLSSNVSSKLETESSKNSGKKGEKSEIVEDSLFVKIKMDGVPIGRKVDLKSFTDYDNLSSAVDELFRGLLAAQGEISKSEKEKMEKTKTITGLLDGRGDYTLVYEDSEGDRMLVGDVPWHMFISSAKRLRVLKEISSSYLKKI